MNNQHKVALITGASSGLGLEMAKALLKKKYQLLLTGRDKRGFSFFSGNPHVQIILGDLTHDDTRKKLADTIRNKYKRLDVLINNAGITYVQPFEENTELQLHTIFETNVIAPILLTHGVYEIMKAQHSGTIVFINSAAGKQGYENHSLYSATKFGLNGFSQSLRLEAKKHHIRIMSIHPGGIKTGLYDDLMKKPDTSSYMDATKVARTIVDLVDTADISPDEIVISRMSK